jgi:membrane protease YdiL (CAAX protease family)
VKPLHASALVTILCGLFYLAALIGLPGTLEQIGWDYVSIHFAIFATRFTVAFLILMVVVPFALKLPAGRQSLPGYIHTIGLSRLRPLSNSIAPGLIAVLSLWTISAILAWSLGLFAFDWEVQFGSPDPGSRRLGWFLFVLALIPGLWEEVAFRGVVLQTLLARHSVRMAMVGSAGFFALFHFANLLLGQSLPEVMIKAVVAFPMGLALAYMTLRTGSLLPAIITHYLLDCFGPFFVAVDPDNQLLGAIFGITTVLFLAPALVVVATRLVARPPHQVHTSSLSEPGA